MAFQNLKEMQNKPKTNYRFSDLRKDIFHFQTINITIKKYLCALLGLPTIPQILTVCIQLRLN